jgi:hypothetical protein
MIVSGIVGLFYVRKRPEKLVGLTLKQATWCGAIAIVCGAAILLVSLWEKH